MRFHPSAEVDASAIVFPGAYIGPNVTIGPDVVIGPGASIGAPGFGYEKQEDGSQQYRTHTAGVIIERDVHIGANACVDQGRHRATVIREGARIDNLVHVGHNVEIGRNALVVALSMLGGTSTVGAGGYVASATLRDHVDVGAGAMAGLGSVVTRSIPEGETWAGVPAKPMKPKAQSPSCPHDGEPTTCPLPVAECCCQGRQR